MGVPQHLWRFPTRESIDSLAKRLGLRNSAEMQDWEWEVADPGRLDEFVSVYFGGELSDDERFTLMETILQTLEDSGVDPELDPRWGQVASALESRIDLHAYTVWHWSCVDDDDPAGWFRMTPWIRSILDRHRARLEKPGGAA